MTHDAAASSRKPYGNKGCFSSLSSSSAVLQQQQQNLRAEPIYCEQTVGEQALAGNPGGTSWGLPPSSSAVGVQRAVGSVAREIQQLLLGPTTLLPIQAL